MGLALWALPAAGCAQEQPQPALEQPSEAGVAEGQAPRSDGGADRAAGGDLIPGLAGLDHVVVAANDLQGALAAYRRLGFTVIPLEAPAGGGAGGLIDLGNGFIELVGPAMDSTGQAAPFTFEGALGQGWEVSSADALEPYFDDRGKMGATVPGTFAPVDSTGTPSPPSAEASGPTFTLAEPRDQPVSGTALYFVEYDAPKLRRLFDEIVRKTGVGEPTEHPNGAVELAYVTVAVSRLDDTVEILKSWGLEPKPPVDDERGAKTVEVELPRGKLYLTAPTTGGGISDFLEERRSKAPPVGNRYFEGAILSIGVGVEDLDETIDWLTDRKVPYMPMRLPNGTVEVVQGAPSWGLRLELVQAGKERAAGWAAHREEDGGPTAATAGTAGSGSGEARSNPSRPDPAASGPDGSR